jgi:hypothetical protein
MYILACTHTHTLTHIQAEAAKGMTEREIDLRRQVTEALFRLFNALLMLY